MDKVAEQFVDRVFSTKVPAPAPKTDADQVTFYRSLNARGWSRIMSKFGVDRARAYRDEMESRARRMGL